MATIRKSRKKATTKRKRSFKQTLKDFLGKGLLESQTTATANLFLLKGALSSRMLNS